MTARRPFLLGTLAALACTGALAQTKWDLPTAYPPSNYHTENLQQFVTDVDKASGGKLKIQLHPNASLFKANEIKRAVQGGQAQAGEILLANFANENPVYALDGIPFLADSYDAAKRLYDAWAGRKEWIGLEGAGHNSTDDALNYWPSIVRFLTEKPL